MTADVLAELRPDVLRFCRSRLGAAAGYTDAEDVCQETLIGVWLALPRYEDRGKPVLALAYTVAAHKVIDAQRAASRHLLEAEAPDWADHDPGPEQRTIAADEVLRLLRGLSELHREVVVLREVVGLTPDEVGAVLGLSAGAVRVAHHRALARLRRWSR